MNTVIGTTQDVRHARPLVGALFGTRQQPLARAQVSNALTLLEDRALTIAAVQGLVLRVHRGTLRISREGERRGYWLVAGARDVAERDGLVTLASPEAVELSVEWPPLPGTDSAPHAS